MTIKAIVPIATPKTEIPEMILITFCDFFENKYRRAMKNGKYMVLRLLVVFLFMSIVSKAIFSALDLRLEPIRF
jgi:hypothetical protein